MTQEQHNDDLDAYLADYTAEEREELEAAGAAIDLAILLHRARAHRGLSQAEAAKRAGLQQQAVSRIERPQANIRLDTLRKYLGALGYTIEIAVKEPDTGQVVEHVSLEPLHAG